MLRSQLHKPNPAFYPVAQEKSKSVSASSPFTDNRPEAIAQRRLQGSMQGTWPGRKFLPGTPLSPVSSQEAPLQALWTDKQFRQEINSVYKPRRSRSQVFFDFFFKSQADVDNPEFNTIGFLLDAYHDETEDSEEARHNKLSFLHELQNVAFEWYSKHKSKDVNGVKQRDPYAEIMVSLLDEVQAEYRIVTSQVVQNKEDIWVPGMEDMPVQQRTQLQRLWSSLTTNSGGLKVTGGGALQQDVHSIYAQLLAGPEGRKLLGTANSSDKLIKIKPTHGQSAVTPNIPSFAHKQVPVKNQKGFHHSSSTESITLDKDHANLLKPGKGTGSTLEWKVQDDSDYAAKGTNYNTAANTGDYELLPSFVTFAHELGHAVRNQRGQSKLRIKNTGDHADWDNAEEKDVIKGVENRIREERGLGKRKYHSAASGRGGNQPGYGVYR